MNNVSFDAVTRSLTGSLTGSTTRRGMTRLLGGLALGGPLTLLGRSPAAAKRKNKRKCAKTGMAPNKKRRKCCAGLVKGGTGRCAQPASGCTALTCGPTVCGRVPDGCGGTLSCGGCAGNSLCLDGTCQPCDVCPSGCFFSSVQDAIAAAVPGETLRICAGLYSNDIAIGKSLTLIGAGDGIGDTILQGSGTGSVVRILAGITVNLQRLRITGGSTATSGGGISNSGSLELTDCTITGNRASGSGGGILSDGKLTLAGCTVSGNMAGNSGGGIRNDGPTLTLTGTTISANMTANVGGGINNSVGTVTLDATSRVTGNQANLTNPDSGGGILNNRGTVTLSSSANVSGNTPDNCGGAVPLCVG